MSDDTAVIPAPSEPGQLVRQPHGGALRQGGNPGNRGRPPSVIREALRLEFERMVPMLVRIARGQPPRKGEQPATMPDRLKALDILAKYGIGVATEVSGPDGAAFVVAVRAAQHDD